jgi:hypothetical protein
MRKLHTAEGIAAKERRERKEEEVKEFEELQEFRMHSAARSFVPPAADHPPSGLFCVLCALCGH